MGAFTVEPPAKSQFTVEPPDKVPASKFTVVPPSAPRQSPSIGTPEMAGAEALIGSEGVKRAGTAALRGFMQGSADIIDTLNMPGTWILGPEKPGSLGPTALAQWLRDHSPASAPAKNVQEKAEDIGGGVTGGFLPGAVAWTGKVPFAIMHGYRVAQEKAKEEHRPQDFGETVRDVVAEAVGRKLMGIVGDAPMGRVTKAIAFGSTQGAVDIAEKRSKEESAIDTVVSGLIGGIIPGMSKEDQARVQAAKDSFARGDGAGAMQHLDPLLKKHEAAIAKAARHVAKTIRPENDEPPAEAPPAAPPPPGGGPAPAPKPVVPRQAMLAHAQKRLADLRNKYQTPEERNEAEFISANANKPEQLAKGYGVEVEPESAKKPEAAPQEHQIAAAKSEIEQHRNNPVPNPPRLDRFIKGLGGIKSKMPNGQPTVGAGDIMSALGGQKQAFHLFNNRTKTTHGPAQKEGMSPDYLRRTLAEHGWFGGVPDEDAANTDISHLTDLLDRHYNSGAVYHPSDPETYALREWQHFEDELKAARVHRTDSADEAARKLAEFRAEEAANFHGSIEDEIDYGLTPDEREELNGYEYEPGADIGAEFETDEGAGGHGEEAGAQAWRPSQTVGARTPAEASGGVPAEDEKLRQPKGQFTVEPGAVDAKGKPLPQTVMPGMERSAKQLAAAREAQGKGRIKPKSEQKEAGPLFAEGKKPEQDRLFQAAYHGSPFEFDKFRNEAIGSGEGAQSFGHGHYFAGRKAIAEYYRDTIAGDRRLSVQEVAKKLHVDLPYEADADIHNMAIFTHDTPEQAAAKVKALYPSELESVPESAVAAIVKAYRESGKGKLYHVELAPKDDEWLDLDKRLSEQSEKVKTAIEKLPEDIKDRVEDLFQRRGQNGPFEVPEEYTGLQFYKALAHYDVVDHASEASELLRKAGVLGNRYGDSSSRLSAALAESKLPEAKEKLAIAEKAVDVSKRLGLPDLSEREGARDKAQTRVTHLEDLMAGRRTHNYVVFDPEHIKIEKVEQPGRNESPPGVAKDLHSEVTRYVKGQGAETPEAVNSEISDWLRLWNSQTGHEAVVIYDAKGNKVSHAATDGDENSVTVPHETKVKALDSDASLILHHNHPSERSLSGPDIAFLAYPGMRWVVAHSQNGIFFAARASGSLLEGVQKEVVKAGWGISAAKQSFAAIVAFHRSATNATERLLQVEINNKSIKAEVATELWSHLTNLVLSKMGLIEYIHSPGLFAEHQGVIDDALSRFPSQSRPEGAAVVPDRPSGAVGFRDGINRILGTNEPPPANVGSAVDEGGRGAVAGESPQGGPAGEQLKLLQPQGSMGEPIGPADRREAFENRPERKPLPESKEVKRDVDASIALRIAQGSHYIAVMKARMDGWESRFKGVSEAGRVKLMSDYQKGGLDAVPKEWRPFFEDFEKLHHEMATSEHAAGIEYELRHNYIAGIWKDPQKASEFFASRPGYGKPGFTKGKEFQTYLDGVEAGLEPLSTNPAVIAAWRAEASARALTRVLAMQDMEHDGFAVKVKDLEESVKRGSPFGMHPEGYPGWRELDVAGNRYLVHPEAARLLDWAFTLDRAALAHILGLDPQGRTMAVASKLGSAWMISRNATIPIKLALSAFHALHILGIDVVQPISSLMTEALNRRITLKDFIKGVKNADRLAAFEYGRHLGDIHRKPIHELSPQERLELNIMALGGFSPRMPSHYEIRAEENWRRLVNDAIPRIMEEVRAAGMGRFAAAIKLSPAMAQGVLLQVGRLTESIQGPLFRTWIPAIKAAAYMNQAKLAISTHPEWLAGTEEANSQMRQGMRSIAKGIDNRFGEMAYDRTFMPRLIRMGFMGSLLSVGWNYGFLREFGGALADAGWLTPKYAPAFVKPLIKGEVSSRIVYASVYTGFSLMVGGLMTWLMSGTPPQNMTDLIYPKLPDGSRRNTMFFTREFGGLWYHVAQEGLAPGLWDMFKNKMVQQLTTLDETLQNQDYYGRQIRDPNADPMTQFEQSMAHVSEGLFSPISLQSTVAGAEESPAGTALSIGGFSPAPKYVTRAAIETSIMSAYSQTHGERVTPYSEIAHFDDTHALKQAYQKWLQTRDPDAKEKFDALLGPFVVKYGSHLGKHGAALKEMLRDWHAPAGAMEFRALDAASQTRILRQASPDERQPYLQYAKPEVRKLFLH